MSGPWLTPWGICNSQLDSVIGGYVRVDWRIWTNHCVTITCFEQHPVQWQLSYDLEVLFRFQRAAVET